MLKLKGLVVALSMLIPTTLTINPAYAHSRGRRHSQSIQQPRRPWESVREAIARCESGGRYNSHSRRSSASGKYQFLRSTWAGRYGVREAYLATPDQQEAAAAALYAASGTNPWRASQRCWGRLI